MSEQKLNGETNPLPNIKPEEVIPFGPYCYFGSRNPADKTYKPCPYWEFVPAENEDERYKGRCNHLNITDGDSGFDLLWDQVKECDINYDYDEE